jgi:DNA-directed RNA polymerase specialized sigma24 family protein
VNADVTKYIEHNYKRWKTIAENITHSTKRNDADDLLHDTLLRTLTLDETKLTSLVEKKELDYYVIRAMYIANNSTRSSFYNEHRKFIDLSNEFTQTETEVVNEWLGARLDNEQLDIAISRLPWFEATIFQYYILDDFTYRKLESATGIPSMYLYRVVEDVKRKLKKVIHKK